jgi:hypothetical protein
LGLLRLVIGVISGLVSLFFAYALYAVLTPDKPPAQVPAP